MRRFLGFGILILIMFALDACEDLAFRDHLDRIVKEQIARVAYYAGEDTDSTEIYIMDSDGRFSKRLTENSVKDRFPDWSPDGTRIAFSSGRASGVDEEIYVMDADGTGIVRVTTGGSGDVHFQPEWSPDGTRLVYTRYWPSWHQDIFVIALSDTGFGINLTNSSGGTSEYEGFPDWSPDGDHIVFMTKIYNDVWQIARLEVASPGNMTRITSNGYADQDPAWSPDGTLIAFFSNRGPSDTNEICVIDATAEDGVPAETRLTDNSAEDKWPEWSPDGSKIIFVSDRDGYNEVYTMNPDGTDQRRLTNTVAKDYCPDWR